MNISLPDELKASVELRVRTGLYANASEYVRELIRVDQARDEWTVSASTAAALDQAESEGLSERSLDEIFAEARSTFAAR